MRWLVGLMLLAGCSEPDFSERYDATEQKIRAQEQAIDKASAEAARREAGEQPAER